MSQPQQNKLASIKGFNPEISASPSSTSRPKTELKTIPAAPKASQTPQPAKTESTAKAPANTIQPSSPKASPPPQNQQSMVDSPLGGKNSPGASIGNTNQQLTINGTLKIADDGQSGQLQGTALLGI